MIEDLLRAALGMIALLGICYLLSNNRRKIDWRLVGIGILLQIGLAFLMLKVEFVRSIFRVIVDFFVMVIAASDQSAAFLFGRLAEPTEGFGFAFYVLPTIIFFAALSSLLYYLGILQKVVFVFAWIMKKSMRLTGAESLAAAANVFIGQTEAPLVIKPYLEKMSKSEILCLMTGGMATIAGGVFGAYMSMLGGDTAEGQRLFGMHLLTASVISAPAAIVAAKILFPETEKDPTEGDLKIPRSDAGDGVLDALIKGTGDGIKLAVNVGAMLLVFMAVIYLFNFVFLKIGDLTSLNGLILESSNGAYEGLSLQYILGMLFSPIAWLLGIPANEMVAVGQLLGEKTILNEFVAYASLTDLIGADALSPKAVIISTYALCGFANFGSIGIMIGGITAIAPGQRSNVINFGFKALVGGSIACFLTAIIAGLFVQ